MFQTKDNERFQNSSTNFLPFILPFLLCSLQKSSNEKRIEFTWEWTKILFAFSRCLKIHQNSLIWIFVPKMMFYFLETNISTFMPKKYYFTSWQQTFEFSRQKWTTLQLLNFSTKNLVYSSHFWKCLERFLTTVILATFLNPRKLFLSIGHEHNFEVN